MSEIFPPEWSKNPQQYFTDEQAAAEEKRRAELKRRYSNQQEGMRNIGMGGQANNGSAAYMTEEQRKRRTAKLDETRQLTQHPSRYLTGLEPSAEILDDYDWNLMPFKWRYLATDGGKQIVKWDLEGELPEGLNLSEDGTISGTPEEDFEIEIKAVRKGVDLDRFKQECEEIDRE